MLMDEVLMYAKEKVIQDRDWRDRLVNFFQYLTQAATKVPRCCIVASLLATDPKKSGDELGRQLSATFTTSSAARRKKASSRWSRKMWPRSCGGDFSRRNRSGTGRRFANMSSPPSRASRQWTSRLPKPGQQRKNDFSRAFPFHPDLTEVLYAKWTQMRGFQRTRGVLRTFALALREAAKWDDSPLVGPAVLPNAPGQEDLSEAMRELVTVADTEEHEGRKTAWTPILVGELDRGAGDTKGVRGPEVPRDRASRRGDVSAFAARSAKARYTRDLTVLVGGDPAGQNRVGERAAALVLKSATGWMTCMRPEGDQLPGTWRLGNRPNLNQMHAVASKSISDDVVRARLIDEIGKVKKLTAGASAAGVQVHTLPVKTSDVKDDGAFRYAVLGPSAACDSGKPSAEARRFLDENTGPDNPRVYRNAALLLCPSKDGLEIAEARIRDYLAWETVRDELKKQEEGGSVDAARMQTLVINIEKAKGRVPEAIRQAYSTVVTVSDKNEDQAFKITVTEDSHFTTIKADKRGSHPGHRHHRGSLASRRALRPVESRRDQPARQGPVRGLRPTATLAEDAQGRCHRGYTGGRLRTRIVRAAADQARRIIPHLVANTDPTRRRSRTRHWSWCSPQPPTWLRSARNCWCRHKLPQLWPTDEITVQAVIDYLGGGKVVQVDKGGYSEPVQIPTASREVVEKAIADAVEEGSVWLLSGPASILGEPIPAGVLTPVARLLRPPCDHSCSRNLTGESPGGVEGR